MPASPDPLIVRVLPDVRGITRQFDYLVPVVAQDRVAVGTEVRIVLHGRRVGGWVTEVGVDAPAGVQLRPLSKVRGRGPDADVLTLARWAAWRWAGPISAFLRTASAPAVVTTLPPPAVAPPPVHVAVPGDVTLLADAMATPGVAVVRFPPAADRYPFLARLASDALRGGTDTAPRSVLVVCPSIEAARRLAARLDRAGLPVALVATDRPGTAAARGWARAAAGGRIVVGARAAAWAPAPGLAAVVVVDEHDEALQEERAPTWHARDVVVERARRAGVPAVLLSPCPTLEALSVGRLLVPSRRAERAGWPAVELVDRRGEDPTTASSLLSPRLVAAIQAGGRVVCVLNRAGRARLLACRSCGDLARCVACGAAVVQGDDGDLRCRRCSVTRPPVCASCGSGALKVARAAVGRLREELEALAGEPVDEVTATTPGTPDRRVVIGTEAALHRVGRADVVAFCDMDQELTAPRFRAGEHALALLVRGARLVGGRTGGGRLLVQTRLPDHAVLQAALHADPGRLVEPEGALRRELRFPPAAALALISGTAANAYVEALGSRLGGSPVELLGPMDGAWLARAPDHQVLADALAATARPLGRLRIEVDPRRI